MKFFDTRGKVWFLVNLYVKPSNFEQLRRKLKYFITAWINVEQLLFRRPLESFSVFWKSKENVNPDGIINKSHVDRQQLYWEFQCRRSHGNFTELLKQYPRLFLLANLSITINYFSSSLITTYEHISSAKPTKLITSPTPASSSTYTPQSSQIQFHPPSNIPLPLLSTVTSPCTPTFPSFPTPTTHSLFSAPPSTSCHHLVPHPPSKILPATPDSSLHVAQHVTEEVQISPAVPHVACGLMRLNLLAKTTTKLLLVCILFLLLLYNFEFLLGLLYFPREIFDFIY